MFNKIPVKKYTKLADRCETGKSRNLCTMPKLFDKRYGEVLSFLTIKMIVAALKILLVLEYLSKSNLSGAINLSVVFCPQTCT